MKYARFGLFDINPAQRADVEALADAVHDLMRQAAGFVSVRFIIDEAAGKAGSLSVWESKELHDAYAEKAFPAVVAKIQSAGLTAPAIQEFEVYEPKG